jgi:hypothetical protein
MKAIIATFALGAMVFAATVSVGAQGTGGSPGRMGHKGGAMMMMGPCHGVVMNAVGGSGESGCATAHGINGAMVLAISVKGEPMGAIQPSHIHRGVCGSNGPVVLPLTNVVNGKSVTTIPMAKWNMMKGGKFYINIHKSPKDIPTIVSCGNVPPMKSAM